MIQRNWQRRFLGLLIFSILNFSNFAIGDVFGATPKSSYQPTIENSQIVKSGDVVRFSGIVIPTKKAARLIALAEGCAAKIDLTKSEGTELLELQKKSYMERLKSRDEFARLEKELLFKRLEKMGSMGDSWYEHPIFVAFLSVSATIAVFYGATEIVKSTK